MLRKKLYAWFRRYGRELPWRRPPTPWGVLVSEFMLQQTTVSTVTPRFKEWMKRFPDPETLARASPDQVFALWQGLGYYRRASNLHAAAAAIVRLHHGKVPGDARALESLPGVGPYTAAAVRAFAFDEAVPVLDANIERVLSRLADLRVPIDKSTGRTRLRAFAAALLPRRGGRLHTSALMDLGALICKPAKPACPACPIRTFCRTENPEQLPLKSAKQARSEFRERRFLYLRGNQIALIRSEGPRWKGLWLLPEAGPGGKVLLEEIYPITRFRATMEVIASSTPPPGSTLFPLSSLPPMPSPHRRALAKAVESSPGGIRA